jgi:antitoxin VapB
MLYVLVYTVIIRGEQDMESIAKIFQNGQSQAVRLPKAFRFKGNEVKISKKGHKVVVEPLVRSEWPEGFWDAFPIDNDFKIPEALPWQTSQQL